MADKLGSVMIDDLYIRGRVMTADGRNLLTATEHKGLGVKDPAMTALSAELAAIGVGVNTRPQTAVLFGDSGIHDGWENYAEGAACQVASDGNGHACAMFNGSGLNTVPGNKMFFGSIIAPFAGVQTITSTSGSAGSVVNVSAITAGTNGCIKVTTATAHGFTTGGVGTIASVTGTPEANGSWYYSIIDTTTFEIPGTTFSHTWVSGGTVQMRSVVNFDVPVGAPIVVDGLPGYTYWGTLSLEKPTRRSWWMNMQAKLGFPFEVLNFSAVNSQATPAMMDRIQADVIDYHPGWCFMHAGANDVRLLGLAPAVAAANAYALIKKCTDNGIKVVYVLWQPDNSTDTAYAAGVMNAKCQVFHQEIRALCVDNTDVVFVDQWKVLSDPASATGDALANTLRSSDGIHTSNLGGQLVGVELASVMDQYVSPRIALPSSHIDAKAQYASSLQLLPNPILFTATGGAVGTGITGTAASGVSVARLAGSPTGTTSVVARTVLNDGDVLGNNQVGVLTGVASGNQVTFDFALTAADIAAGDVLEAVCHVRSSGAKAAKVNMISAYLFINTYTYKAACTGPSLTGTDYDMEDVNEYQRVRMVVPPGITVSTPKFSLIVQFSGAGSAVTVSVGRVAVRKINRDCLPM